MVVVHSLSSNRHRVPLSNLKTPGFLNEVCFPPSGTAFCFFVFSAYLCKLNTFISFHIIWLSWKPLQVQIRVPLSKSHVNRRRFRSRAFVKVFVAYKRFSSSDIWRTGGKSEGKRLFSSLSVDPMSFFLHCNQKQSSNCADLRGNFKSRFWTLCNLGLFNGSLNIGKKLSNRGQVGFKKRFLPPSFVLVQFQSDWDIIWRVSGFFFLPLFTLTCSLGQRKHHTEREKEGIPSSAGVWSDSSWDNSSGKKKHNIHPRLLS